MTLEFIDPTHEGEGAAFSAAPRLSSLRGARVGIVSNGKKGTVRFFDAMERELKDGYGVAEVVRLTKGNYSAPMEDAVLGEASELDAIIAGVGD